MKKYCILDSYVYPDSDFHQEKEILEAAGYTAEIGNCHTAEEIMEFAKDAEVIGVVYLPITEEILGSLPNLKAVVRYGVGYDCVDVEACTRHQVFCCNQPDYCLEDVASLTLAMLLDLTRKITFFDRRMERCVRLSVSQAEQSYDGIDRLRKYRENRVQHDKAPWYSDDYIRPVSSGGLFCAYGM